MKGVNILYSNDHELTELFYQIVRQLNHLARSNPQDIDPFSGQYKCLFLLDEADSISQRKLASILEIRSTSLSELLAKLQKKGYVSRTVSEKDKRTYLISLTPKGKEEVARVRSMRLRDHHELTDPLTLEDKTELHRILSKIKKYYIQREVMTK